MVSVVPNQLAPMTHLLFIDDLREELKSILEVVEGLGAVGRDLGSGANWPQ